MNGANLAPPCPILATTTSFRMKSTIASMAPAKPPGALPAARCRISWFPAAFMVQKTRREVMIMKTTCLVGVRLMDIPPSCTTQRSLGQYMYQNGLKPKP